MRDSAEKEDTDSQDPNSVLHNPNMKCDLASKH